MYRKFHGEVTRIGWKGSVSGNGREEIYWMGNKGPVWNMKGQTEGKMVRGKVLLEERRKAGRV